jgi:hypothetical protein
VGVSARDLHALELAPHEARQVVGIRERAHRIAIGVADDHQGLAVELRTHAVLGARAVVMHAAGVIQAIQDAAENPGAEQHGHDHRQRRQRQHQLRASPRASARRWIRDRRSRAGSFTGQFRL